LNIMSGISKQVCDLPERYVLMIIVLMVSSGIGYVDIFFFWLLYNLFMTYMFFKSLA
jgi:hypothetical protein